MEFFYSNVNDVPRDVVDDLLCAVMSAPSLETVTATYARDLADFYHVGEYHHIPPGPRLARPLPILGSSRCTDLRELRLHWDHLSLDWLSALLRLPRSLEVLHLQLSRSNPLVQKDGRPAVPLNSALRPVAHSLRELTIFPIKDYGDKPREDECWRDDLHIEWGDDGLREFRSLEYLGAPADSWTPAFYSFRRPEGALLALPESLERLHIFGACLIYQIPAGWNVPSEDGFEIPRSLTLDCKTLNGLRDIYTIVNSAPRLGYIQVISNKELDLDYLQGHLPPVHLPRRLKRIVDSGIRILVELPEGGSVELETCLD
ncbi:hypothetical protein IMZ48_08990 [Candidatus Bathyarchaeota archaeon]|nr:hypothetical protein [Candidatus Bathyarchaeota archaeon]